MNHLKHAMKQLKKLNPAKIVGDDHDEDADAGSYDIRRYFGPLYKTGFHPRSGGNPAADRNDADVVDKMKANKR